MIIHAIVWSLLATALSTPAQAAPLEGGPQAECAMAVAVALDYGKGEKLSINPQLSKTAQSPEMDCTDAFRDAGFLPYQPSISGNSLRNRMALFFTRATVIDPDHVTMDLGMRCGGRCGQGYRYTLEFKANNWQITSRTPTWIS